MRCVSDIPSSEKSRADPASSAVADFGVVDPNVSAADEAARNNDRPETLLWVEKFRKVIEGEPDYHDYDEVYRTDQ